MRITNDEVSDNVIVAALLLGGRHCCVGYFKCCLLFDSGCNLYGYDGIKQSFYW